jgi:hypothetical protein
MKKVITLSLGLISLPLISALEPVIPHGNALDFIYPTLNTVLTDIKSAYQEQWTQFNAAPTSEVPSIFTPKVKKAITSLKNSTAKLSDLLSTPELKGEARDLRNIALQIINSMQVLDGNIEKVLDDESYKKTVDDTLLKLQKLEKKAESTVQEALINKMGKLKKSKSTPPFRLDEVIAIENCARIIMNIASTVREANEKILNVFFKPKKSKSFFGNLFRK